MEVFSKKITKGNRTYFFDIKKSKQDRFYLKISESKKTKTGFEHYHIMIFEEDIQDIAEMFGVAILRFKELKKSEAVADKNHRLNKIRQTHANAYEPWTVEDDSKLEMLFCRGSSIIELSKIFRRQKGAITSRIRKLQLREKYSL